MMSLRTLALTTIFIGAGFAGIAHAGSLVAMHPQHPMMLFQWFNSGDQ